MRGHLPDPRSHKIYFDYGDPDTGPFVSTAAKAGRFGSSCTRLFKYPLADPFFPERITAKKPGMNDWPYRLGFAGPVTGSVGTHRLEHLQQTQF